MLTVMIVGLAMGSTVLIGKAIGAQQKDEASTAIGHHPEKADGTRLKKTTPPSSQECHGFFVKNRTPLRVGTLPHYEKQSLLQPEYIDPETRYRYYSTRQFESLNTIRYLRVLDTPLNQIADFIACKFLASLKKSR